MKILTKKNVLPFLFFGNIALLILFAVLAVSQQAVATDINSNKHNLSQVPLESFELTRQK